MFEQERVIGRLQRSVMADPAVMACFLSGSFGRRTEDAFSDLDVALVYADDESREQGWQERSAFAKSIMPYVSLKAFDAAHVRPYFYVTLFANGSKVDYRFESAASLAPNPWDGQIRILKDADNWAERYQNQSSRLSKPQPAIDRDLLVDIDQRFWVMFWDTLRLLARGNADKPFPIYLEMLNATLPTLLYALPGSEPSYAALVNAYFEGSDVELTRARLQDFMGAYLAARAALERRYALQTIGDMAFESEIGRLIQKLA